MGNTDDRTGPVVRISPGQLHSRDPHFYDDVYAPASRKREKDPASVTAFGTPHSMLTTVGHDQHRFRRGLLNNYFSKKSVTELSPIIQQKLSMLMQRFQKASQEGNVLHLDDAFNALTGDIISQYVWGVSAGFLDDENFKNEVRQALTEMSNLVHVSKFFPMLATMFKAMPRWLVAKLRPGATAVLDMQDLITERYNAQKDETKTYKKTIFDALTDPSVPPEERSSPRLADEGMILMVAGTDTTARVLSMAAFQLYQDEHLLEKVREELGPVMATPISKATLSELEQLPLLSAVVNEALRVAFASTLRSPRVAPTESLRYKGLVIPPGVCYSSSPVFALLTDLFHYRRQLVCLPTSYLRTPRSSPNPNASSLSAGSRLLSKVRTSADTLLRSAEGADNALE